MKLFKICVSITGILLVISSFMHSLGGINQINELGITYGIPKREIQGLTVGWVWGSVTMMALGIWCFFIIASSRLNLKSALYQSLTIGSLMLLFGLLSMLYLHELNHLVGFSIFGLLLLVPTIFLIKNKTS